MTRGRKFIAWGFVLVFALLLVHTAQAQDAPAAAAAANDGWPTIANGWQFQRGPGFYFDILKIVLSVALFLLWVKTTDWVSQDTMRLNLNSMVWNPIVFGAFAFSFIMLWVLPTFAICFPLMLLAYFAPLGAYITMRNQKVDSHQRLLTPAYFRQIFSGMAGKVGVEVKAEKQLDYQRGAPVEFKAATGSGRGPDANLSLARRSMGYVRLKGLIADILDRGGDGILMEFTPESVTVRYQIDGLWHNAEPLEREQADMVLSVLKLLGGLDPSIRGKRQDASFEATYEKSKYTCVFQCQGVEAGERAAVFLRQKKTKAKTLEELGMRPKIQASLEILLNKPQGMVLFAGLPAGGLSSLFDGALSACDCYVRDFVAVEDEKAPEYEVENVHATTYNPAAGETLLPVLQKIVRSYPNVIVVRNLPDAESTKFLCDQVQDERLVLAAIRAKDAPEALLRVLMLKVPPKDFVGAISGVAAVRLVRKLCDECKEAFAPPPEMLQQFGIPAGKIQTLYQPPSQPDPKRPCPNCQGIGYKGRIGLFELLVVDDGVRDVLLKNPKLDAVRAAARKAGLKTFQEEGLVLVVKGVTSLAELQRVLKQ